MQFKKKDIIDFLILEIDDLEPRGFYYKYYYNSLIDEYKKYDIKERYNFIKNLIIKKYNNILNYLIKIQNIYIEKVLGEDIVEDEKIENNEEIIVDKEVQDEDYKNMLIDKLKDCDLNLINCFMEKEKFICNKELIEKTLKRHIILEKNNHSCILS
tara:strand:- start:283 stop:750 length:468 start_codon:yes stop_codon:yes gene_type:complete